MIEQMPPQMRELIEDGDPVEMPGVVCRLERITPERAYAMLETMVANRTVSQGLVNKLKSDMPDRWKITGQGITFDAEGHLTDGQHRLWGIIESGEAIVCLVVYGAERDAMPAMDSGRLRTFADDLRIEGGYKDYSTLSATVKMIYVLEEAMSRKVPASTIRNDPLSRFHLKDLLEQYQDSGDLISAVAWGKELNKKPLRVPPSATAASHYILTRRYGTEAVNPFFNALLTGEGLYKGMPVKTLRDRFEREAQETGKPSSLWYVEAILRMFIASVKGYTRSKYQTSAVAGLLPELPKHI